MSGEIETLNSVSLLIEDCLHATAPITNEGYPLIRTPNIGKGRLKLSGVFRVTEEVYEKWTRRAVPRDGDLILAREAPAGNIAIVKNGEKVCLGQRTVLIRPNPHKVDSDFLCYYLLAPRQQGFLLSGATGVTAAHVNMKDIRRLPLYGLPNLDLQKRIGSILSTYDDLIENNQRRIALLEEAARLLYQEWFVRLRFPGHEHTTITNGIPDGWERVQLGERVVLNYGKALKSEERIPGPFQVFGSSGIVGTHEKPLSQGPGIILGRKGNVGSVFWSAKDFYAIDTVYYIDSPTSNLYLFYALKNMHFLSTDVAVPGLNRDLAYSRPLLIPANTVLQAFLEIVSVIYVQIGKLDEMNQKLRSARDLLLPRLMSGQIEI